MINEYEKIIRIAENIRLKTQFEPEIAVILGSGLGELTNEVEGQCVIRYDEIDGFPVPTVKGHAGRIVMGYLENRKVALFEGRVHYYESMDMQKAVLITRIIKVLGINRLILTNAAGGMGEFLNEGDIMAIKDHITSFVPSPLLGRNIDELGTRFPDMTDVYDRKVTADVIKRVKELNIDLKEGVYLQTTGPNYETPAEIRMYKMLGADAVGMSTACEAMTARHMGMQVCAFSCITNMAAGLAGKELTHGEVAETAARVSGDFRTVVKEAIKCMTEIRQ